MKSKKPFFELIPNSIIFIIIIASMFFKLIFDVLIHNQMLIISLGGGSDANYYDSYATGYNNIALNIWPVILRYLNSVNLYSRDVISFILLLLNLFAIPYFVCKLSNFSIKDNQKYIFYVVLLCSIYPTLYFYSLDIYRDVFIVFTFLLGCIFVKKSFSSSTTLRFFCFFILSALVGWFLFELRPYMGYAFLLSLLLWKITFTKKRIIFLGVFYFLVLFIANYLGVLNSLTEYRSGFEEVEGGSTLGLNFSNPLLFVPNFILSALGQLFGLYITNAWALILLLLETAPFAFMLIYVVKNIKFADSFLRFLIIFSIIYGSVWLIGNDNLGTAVRLRMCNYLAIYICFFYILKVKNEVAK